MRSFDHPKGPKPACPVSKIEQNGDSLIVVLTGSEHKTSMDKFFRAMVTEFRTESSKPNAFTFEYDENSLSYNIKLNQATVVEVLKCLDANKLLPPREPTSRSMSPRRD